MPGCGASGFGRSPTPDPPFFGACGRGPLPTGCGCGGCGPGDPSPTPRRALLRAGFARCGSGTRAPGGGASCLGVGLPGSGALPSPTARPLGRAAGAHCPTAVGAGGVGPGNPSTTRLRALLRAGFARCGGGTRAPGGGGASCLYVGRPGSGALPPSTARPLGSAPEAQYPLAVGAGGAGVGTRHQPHSARSCELALGAVGAARGRPGGAPRAWVWGIRVWALSHPRPPVLWGVQPGPTTHWLWVRGGWALVPVTNPTARALASWLCALWGRHEGARGGAPRSWVWGARGWALSHPRPPVLWGVQPGPTTHWLWVRGVWACAPVTKPTARALASCRCALWGRHESARGGGASGMGVGRRKSGALPPPTACPLGRAAGALYPLAVEAGAAGVGTCHQPHSARSCELALRPVSDPPGQPRGPRTHDQGTAPAKAVVAHSATHQPHG